MLNYKNDYPVRFIRVTPERLDYLFDHYDSLVTFIENIKNE